MNNCLFNIAINGSDLPFPNMTKWAVIATTPQVLHPCSTSTFESFKSYKR